MFGAKLNLISVGTNAKTKKGDTDESLTAIMYLAPNTISGHDVCPSATPGCIASCLFTAGRGMMNSVQQARIRKTKLFFEDPHSFLKLLYIDIYKFSQFCLKNNIQPYVRLNGTSDIRWETIEFASASGVIDNIFGHFPDVRFYDYTKIPDRKIPKKNTNYKLTYSRDENDTLETVSTQIKNGLNVSAVFADGLPDTYYGHTVVDGDVDDMRWNDPAGVIVGLKAKGLAKKDQSGFVIRTINI